MLQVWSGEGEETAPQQQASQLSASSLFDESDSDESQGTSLAPGLQAGSVAHELDAASVVPRLPAMSHMVPMVPMAQVRAWQPASRAAGLTAWQLVHAVCRTGAAVLLGSQKHGSAQMAGLPDSADMHMLQATPRQAAAQLDSSRSAPAEVSVLHPCALMLDRYQQPMGKL